jgi:hypothetical protein
MRPRNYPPSKYQSVVHPLYPVNLSHRHKYFDRTIGYTNVPGVPAVKHSKKRFDPRLTDYANYLVLCKEVAK